MHSSAQSFVTKHSCFFNDTSKIVSCYLSCFYLMNARDWNEMTWTVLYCTCKIVSEKTLPSGSKQSSKSFGLLMTVHGTTLKREQGERGRRENRGREKEREKSYIQRERRGERFREEKFGRQREKRKRTGRLREEWEWAIDWESESERGDGKERGREKGYKHTAVLALSSPHTSHTLGSWRLFARPRGRVGCPALCHRKRRHPHPLHYIQTGRLDTPYNTTIPLCSCCTLTQNHQHTAESGSYLLMAALWGPHIRPHIVRNYIALGMWIMRELQVLLKVDGKHINWIFTQAMMVK